MSKRTLKGLQEAEKSWPIEMFTEKSMEVSDQYQVFSYVPDVRSLLSCVGLPRLESHYYPAPEGSIEAQGGLAVKKKKEHDKENQQSTD